MSFFEFHLGFLELRGVSVGVFLGSSTFGIGMAVLLGTRGIPPRWVLVVFPFGTGGVPFGIRGASLGFSWGVHSE